MTLRYTIVVNPGEDFRETEKEFQRRMSKQMRELFGAKRRKSLSKRKEPHRFKFYRGDYDKKLVCEVTVPGSYYVCDEKFRLDWYCGRAEPTINIDEEKRRAIVRFLINNGFTRVCYIPPKRTKYTMRLTLFPRYLENLEKEFSLLDANELISISAVTFSKKPYW